MKKTLLINQFNTDEDLLRKGDIFFLIGNMALNREHLLNVFNSTDSPYYKKCTFKPDGILLSIQIKDIPSVIALLIEEGFSVYNVYELYSPM
ncbi:MAG: hypothetical protein Q4Q07_05540 [Tissierellia bacterium]|nr:hypothetical protein [Tissierellia bacterium]